jgi:hypothetical protein
MEHASFVFILPIALFTVASITNLAAQSARQRRPTTRHCQSAAPLRSKPASLPPALTLRVSPPLALAPPKPPPVTTQCWAESRIAAWS